MDIDQLFQIQGAVEEFFRKIRINIALHAALTSQEFGLFYVQTQQAITRQVRVYATQEKVEEITEIGKADGDSKYLAVIEKYWIPFFDIVDQDQVYRYHVWAANQGGQAALDKLQTGVRFRLENESLLSEVAIKSSKLGTIIDDTTKDWIARTIEQARKNNLDPQATARLLRDEAVEHARMRSAVITEQETILFMGEMEEEVYERNTIAQKQWITSRDERVCPQCNSNENAGIIKVGSVFPSGTLNVPAHVRCRCIVTPVISAETNITWTGQ